MAKAKNLPNQFLYNISVSNGALNLRQLFQSFNRRWKVKKFELNFCNEISFQLTITHTDCEIKLQLVRIVALKYRRALHPEI